MYSWLERAPDHVRDLTLSEVGDCLARVEDLMRGEPALLEFGGKTVFVGDTHGDFVITKAVAERFFEDKTQKIVFLGDYIDRAPVDVGSSLPNILYLLFLKTAYPNQVVLLRGNHEATYAIPCFPYDFEDEVETSFPGMHERFLRVFAQMPLMVLVNKVFAAHGGILKGCGLEELRGVGKNDVQVTEAITWSDPSISPNFRGAGYPFSSEDVNTFLNGVGAKVFLRGHDYNTLGMAIFNELCLTIFSSRKYRNMGNKGILIAIVEEEVSGLKDLAVEDFSDNVWKRYKVKKLRV